MSSRRVTVKRVGGNPPVHAGDEDDQGDAVVGFSFVVRDAEHDLDDLRARVRRQFRLTEADDVILVDQDGAVVDDVGQLVDRHQLQVQVRPRTPSPTTTTASSSSATTSSDSDDEWIAEHRVCLYPSLIRSPMGQQHCRDVLARLAAFGAVFVAAPEDGVFRSSTNGLELRLSPSAVPVNVPVPCAVDDLGVRLWAVLLCHGGYFAGAVLDGAGLVLAHRTARRYVRRRRRGRRQANYEGGAGHTSAGGQLRQQQETAFRNDVRGVLRDWDGLLRGADLVLAHAPGQHNRAALFGDGDGPLRVGDARVRPVPISTGRALLTEALAVARTLTMVELRTTTPTIGW